jgi:hypothetical protein
LFPTNHRELISESFFQFQKTVPLPVLRKKALIEADVTTVEPPNPLEKEIHREKIFAVSRRHFTARRRRFKFNPSTGGRKSQPAMSAEQNM